MINWSKIYEAIRVAGFEFTKSYYNDWKEIFAEELNDPDSFYYNSVSSKGFPYKEQLERHVSEISYHNYCCDGTDELLYDYIKDFSEEEIDAIENNYLYDYFEEGIEKFIKENYI